MIPYNSLIIIVILNVNIVDAKASVDRIFFLYYIYIIQTIQLYHLQVLSDYSLLIKIDAFQTGYDL